MFKLLAKAQDMERTGKEVIHFEIGDPDYNTPDHIVKAASDSMVSGETHYVSSMGLTEFRELVCNATLNSRGFSPDINQVLITPGANIIIYYAIRCLVNPGEEVIVPDPGFPTYFSVINFCGAKAVSVPLKEENSFRMSPDDIRKKITKKTRLIIINSPQNPTGSVMTPKEIDEVANIAEENDVYLFSDEIYARMVFDDSGPFRSPSIKDRCNERTIISNGFSKAFAMTGWRLGCVIGPEPVINKMGLLLQTTSSCVPPFIQKAGMAAISGDQNPVKAMMKEYALRRDLLVDGLNRIPGIKCLKPGGAFYVFPNIKGTGMSSKEFATYMLEEAGVALLPGTNFGGSGEGYLRLCYAINRENISKGLEKIEGALNKKKRKC
jgi:aspartate/methionine/tyrosine aminotransferase